MRTLKGLVIGVSLLCVFWTMPAHATIDWEDSFEYANSQALYSAWSASCPYTSANPAISTDRAFSGSKSVKLTYNGTVGVDPGAGGCFIDRYLNALSDTLYMRVYMWIDPAFQVNYVGTKMINIAHDGHRPNFWWEMLFSQTTLSVVVSSLTPPAFNVYGNAIPRGQWACLEGQFTMNTPGVPNGIIRTWVNGAAQINRTDLLLRNATTIDDSGPTSQIHFVRIYTQHGVGLLYYDDFAVSRNARIGCTGSPAGDIQAPRAPSNLR